MKKTLNIKNKYVIFIIITIFLIALIGILFYIKANSYMKYYKFENNNLYVGNDNNKWIQVPGNFKETINHLENGMYKEGTYQISKEKIVFYYEEKIDDFTGYSLADKEGNESKYLIYLVYSDNNGKTWNKYQVAHSENPKSITYINFKDAKNGEMHFNTKYGEEYSRVITTNGGKSWKNYNIE